MPNQVLDFPDALAVVLQHAARITPPASAHDPLSLATSLGRVLAAPIRTPRDQPPFDRSTRDGYALRAAELHQPLHLLGLLRAGEHWSGEPLQPGQCLEIMTGAPLPAGADAVVMIEHTRLEGATVHVEPGRTLQPGDNVVPRGAEALAADELLSPGHRLDAAALALAANCGRSALAVYRQPTVALIATGDELLEAGSPRNPEPWQIYNSNTHGLTALTLAAGGDPRPLPIARDTLEDLRARLDEARGSDLVLFTGGVSMGKYDLVEQALAEAGAEFFFTGARIQPGKPIVFGRFPTGTYFFGLPGNPVSTEVCFHLFVAPLLRALSGQRPPLAPRFVLATVSEAFQGRPALTRFLPAYLEDTTVRPVAWQGSGDLAANARSNCFAVVEPGGLAPGQTAQILLR
ncbi:MAG: molybdopterin molybdotransferase MoeA [Acidobacteriaceae bacterium]|nr:molybdopterin molybdotransferase MoeA [Acidobacteriaceae bacterium]